MTVAEWRRRAARSLLDTLGDSLAASIEVDALLCHVLQKSRTWLFAYPESPLDPEALQTLDGLLKRRCSDEPLAYLTGEREFRSRTFYVNNDVLVPRDDTEVLVDSALAAMQAYTGRDSPCRVVELGTGSGIVAICLALEAPSENVLITATDIDAQALDVARRNAQRHGAGLGFVQADWLAPFADNSVDILVSNPPYIATGDKHLDRLTHEPQHALVSGVEGLSAIKALAEASRRVLRAGGHLIIEHGYDQQAAVAQLFARAGLTNIGVNVDLAQRARVSFARHPDSTDTYLETTQT